jgi:hypothetical protein
LSWASSAPQLPDAEQVARLVGPLMCMALHSPLVHALIDGDHDKGWKLRWGGTCTVVSAWEPGRFEYADHWYIDVELGERGIDLSLLLLYITAAAIATIGNGWIIQEVNLVNGGRLAGRELSAGDLLTRAVGEGLDRSPQDVLAALGSHSWGELRMGGHGYGTR